MAFRAPEYERFTGDRRAQPPWWPIWKATFRRGWNSKWVKWITLGAIGMAAAITLMLYFVQKVAPEWRQTMESVGDEMGGDAPPLRFDASVYLFVLHWFVYPFLLPISVLLGYDLIAGDLRSNALESYFSRPVTPGRYLLGRTGAFTAFLLLVSLVPLLWIWTFDVTTAPDRTVHYFSLEVESEGPLPRFTDHLRRRGWYVDEDPAHAARLVVSRTPSLWDVEGLENRLRSSAERYDLGIRSLVEERRMVSHFQRVKQVPLGLTAVMVLVALTMALFVQALTTITRSGTWTALVIVVLFVFSGTIGPVLFEITKKPALQAAAFWENIYVVANGFLGFPGETNNHAPFGLSLTILLVLLFGSLFVLVARVKRKGLIG